MLLFVVFSLIVGLHLGLVVWIASAWFAVRSNVANSEGLGIPVSVIVCAKNEAENLPTCLQALLNQTVTDYEVIVVNDHSTDNTAQILTEWEENYPDKLITMHVSESIKDWSPKKYALHCGMLLARYDYFLLTDADCVVKPNWVELMRKPFAQGKNIVLGYSPYQSVDSLLNILIRFETFHTAFLYLGLAKIGLPYMGVGRNLGIERNLFFESERHNRRSQTLSGVDDLTVNWTANATNTAVVSDPDSFVYSQPKRKWSDWFWQKTRHISSSKQYRSSTTAFLSLFHLSHLFLYILFALNLTLGWVEKIYPLSVFLFYLFVKWVCFLLVNKHLKEKLLNGAFLFLDLFNILYNLIIVPAGLLSRPVWKQNYPDRPAQKKTAP